MTPLHNKSGTHETEQRTHIHSNPLPSIGKTKMVYSYTGNAAIFPPILNFVNLFFQSTTTHKQQDTPDNGKPENSSDEIISGQACKHSSQTTSKDVAYANK